MECKNVGWKIPFGARAFHKAEDRALKYDREKYVAKSLELVQKQKKCKWNELDRLKRFNRSKRTTFSSKPFIPAIFWLRGPEMNVPFIFHPKLPESLCKW